MEKACSICSHPCITARTGPTTFYMLAGLVMKPSSIRGRRGEEEEEEKISEKMLRRRKSRKIEKEQQ